MNFSIFSNFWGCILIILLFGGSIFIHELGHFLMAKAFGLKILRFSIGFGPKLFQWQGKDGCKYMVSLLPLGGYVAIPQLVDLGKLEGEEDDDAEKTANLPKATCLAKVCVSLAGALFNVILAFILAIVVWYVGVPEQEVLRETRVGGMENIVDAHGIEYESPAKLAGIKEGDKILSIDNHKVNSFEDIIEQIAMGSGRNAKDEPLAKIEILRNNNKLTFDVHPKLIKTNISTGDEIRMIGVQPARRMIVDTIMENSPAQKAGFKVGDEVVGINSQKIYAPSHLSKVLSQYKNNESVNVNILRDKKSLILKTTPKRIYLTKQLLSLKFDNKEIRLLEIDSPNKCIKVFSKTPNQNVDIADVLYQINGKKVKTFADIKSALAENKNDTLNFVGTNFELKDIHTTNMSIKEIPQKSRIMLGYQLKDITVVRHPSVAKQFITSIEKVVNALTSLINPKSDIGISSLAGPVDIGRVIYKLSDTAIMLVISFTVLLNINLAVLNLLPLPVLDGGHIALAIIEKIRGKALPSSVFAIIQTIFALMFMALMAYVVYIGFARWNGDNILEKHSEIYNHYNIKTKF